MQNKNPTVSVLMTAYNREKYIAEAIESVLASTFTDFELIIVDDRSSDTTVSIAKTYEKKDDRLQVFINEKNLGDYPNRNKAVSLAKGKYMMFCDSDDCFFPDSIQYCINAMDQYPEAGIGFYYAQEKDSPFLMSGKKAVQHHFFETPILVMGPGGTIMKRDFFLRIGGYPEKYGPANDMYFNLKVCTKSEILMLPKNFLFYRIHEGQEKNNAYSYMYNNYRYLTDALQQLDLGLDNKQQLFLKKKNNRRFSVNMIRYFLRTKDFSSTKQLWVKAGFSVKNFVNGIFHF